MKWTKVGAGYAADVATIEKTQPFVWEIRIAFPNRIEYIERRTLASAKRAAEKLLRAERMRQ